MHETHLNIQTYTLICTKLATFFFFFLKGSGVFQLGEINCELWSLELSDPSPQLHDLFFLLFNPPLQTVDHLRVRNILKTGLELLWKQKPQQLQTVKHNPLFTWVTFIYFVSLSKERNSLLITPYLVFTAEEFTL